PLVAARSAPLRSAGMKPVAGIRANLLPRIQLPVPAPSVTPAPKPAVQEKPVTSSSLQIALKYLRVTIQRPWMDPMLFHLKGWSLDGVDAGAMSNGSTDNNPGFFPLLPIAFVAVKGVQISGNWSPDDKAFAAQASVGGNAAAFGPLALSGGTAGQSAFQGCTLTVPGMQILAWISTPM